MKPKDQLRAVAGNVVRRRKGDEETFGVLAPLEDGRPLPEGAEIVKVALRRDGDDWHDVEVLYRNASGPAQVATPAYREGYDRIFGKKPTVGVA